MIENPKAGDWVTAEFTDDRHLQQNVIYQIAAVAPCGLFVRIHGFGPCFQLTRFSSYKPNAPMVNDQRARQEFGPDEVPFRENSTREAWIQSGQFKPFKTFDYKMAFHHLATAAFIAFEAPLDQETERIKRVREIYDKVREAEEKPMHILVRQQASL